MINYSSAYSDESFWSKIGSILKKASRELLMMALQLYYTAQLTETPVWAKGVIYGALGYLILPVDLVLDFLPGGYVDDLSVLAAAIVTVTAYITLEVKSRAEETISSWFN